MALGVDEGGLPVLYVAEARVEANPFRLLKTTQYTVVQLTADEARRVQGLDRRIEEGKRQFDRESPGIQDNGQRVRRHQELVARPSEERRRILEGQNRYMFTASGDPRYSPGAVLPKKDFENQLVPYGTQGRRLETLQR